MRLLDHGIALVADHDGPAINALDHLAGSRRDMPQARLLFDLLAGPAEFALLEDDKQIAAEANLTRFFRANPRAQAPGACTDEVCGR